MDESNRSGHHPPSRPSVPVDTPVDRPSNQDSSLSNANTNSSNTEESSDDSSENVQSPRPQSADHSITECTDDHDYSEGPRQRIVMTTEDNDVAANVSEIGSSDGADSTTIKLKFLDDTQKLVATWLTQTVGEFKR